MEPTTSDAIGADGAMRKYFHALPPTVQAALGQSRMQPEDLDALKRAAGRLMNDR